MEDKRLIYLYQKFSTRTATKAEVEEFEAYLNTPKSQQHLIALLEEDYIKLEESLGEMNPESDQRIYNYVINQAQELSNPAVTSKLWLRIGIAAAVATIIFGAGLFYFNRNSDQGQSDQIARQIQVVPGKTGATLTLANGKKISLSDAANGTIASQAGVRVSKTANGQLIYQVQGETTSVQESTATNTLATARGETYQVRLPDGSLVFLNAASSLTYAANLSSAGEMGVPAKRMVKLQGEAYFEIAKDKAHPFVVESKGQQVEVLGTHFNISSYPDDPSVTTTLLEGSVRVSLDGGKGQRVLRPDQQAWVDGSGLHIREVVAEDAVDWKNGLFAFDNDDMESAMRKIARWYNVSVSYESEELKSGTFFGSFSRFENIDKVLRILEKGQKVSFERKGNVIVVKEKSKI